MKSFTILANLVLLALTFFGIFTGGNSANSGQAYIQILLIAVTVINAVILAGSKTDLKSLPGNLKKSINHRQVHLFKGLSFFKISKAAAVVLNVCLLIIIYLLYRRIPEPPGHLIFYLLLFFVLITPLFSIVAIAAASSNKFVDIKRTLIITFSGLVLLFSAFVLSMYIWIGHDVKANIRLASGKYPGRAEDALMEYLRDENNSPGDRSSVAIWTLGHIRSEKALPLLYSYYKDDPEGRTCKGRHKYVICQYELHKAINKIENSKYRWFSFARLNK